jgi:mannose-1-phosphate guanylyltransferase
VVRGPMQAVTLDTKNSLIYTSKRLVTTAGVEDLIIVDTEDALLVCPRDRAESVRQIVDWLKQAGLSDYLVDFTPKE